MVFYLLACNISADKYFSSTQYEPYLDKGNEGMVHHLIVYECGGNFTEDDLGVGINCFNYSNMPFTRCRSGSLLGGWAIGAEVGVEFDDVEWLFR